MTAKHISRGLSWARRVCQRRRSQEAALRMDASLTTDVGIGIVRYARSGYGTARAVAEGRGGLTADRIKVPLWWSPEATFGPEAGE